MSRKLRALSAGVFLATCLLGAVAAFLLARLHSLGGAPQNAGLGDVLGSLGFASAGAYLARRRQGNPLGWLLLGIGLTEELSNAGSAYGVLATHLSHGLPLSAWLLWVAAWVWLPGFGLLATVVVQIYPHGRPGSARAMLLLQVSCVAIALATLGMATAPGAVVDTDTPHAVNPVGAAGFSTVAGIVGGALLAACILLSVAGCARRLWRAPVPLRQQLALLLTATVLTVAIKGFLPIEWIASASLGLIPAAIAIGVVRYRLLGIETVVRRTLLYLPLTGLVATAFTLLTAGMTALLPTGPLPNLLAAAVVVLGIAPARSLLQRAVDRLVRGPVVDPVAALAGVGSAAASGDDQGLVDRVVESVAIALRSPYVAVVDPAGQVLSAHGSPAGQVLEVPLQYAGQSLGALVLSEGGSQELVAALAPQVAVVVRAAERNADLDSARQQVVEAAMAERGRLRRDLHDGLGPSLSGVSLGLEAVTATLAADPAAARAMLDRAQSEVTAAVVEVRRLLDGLRPPELGTYGLAAALRERLAVPGIGPPVQVTAPAALPALDPEVELAAYRIVCEAVTNARKHARATRCHVDLEVSDGLLRVQVADDGVGIAADAVGGVGLVSMRHRAEDVGGDLRVASGRQGGTTVQAHLPAAGT